MIKKIYSIYDIAVQAYMNPYIMLTDEQAKRSFEEACNDPESNLAKHPHDYSLHLVGHFDDHNGTIEATQPTIRIAQAVDYTNIRKNQKQLSIPLETLKEA